MKFFNPSLERTFFAIILVLTLFAAVGHFRSWNHDVPEDLRAFYCAGVIVAHHQDPYLVEPLLTCERNIAVANAADWNDAVDPAPLPGYDMIALSALSLLPMHTATLIFGVFILASTVITGYALSRLSPYFPFPVALLLAYFGMTYVGSSLGQLAPPAIASLAVGALFLRRGKQEAAALATCCALLQPQFALPSIAALFLFVPRTRIALASAIIGIAAVSCLVLGPHMVLEYFTVLKIHSTSELNWPTQYSLAWLIRALGGNPHFAMLMGTVSAVVLLVWCFFILFRYREEAMQNGAIILLPAAYAVIGGTYIHAYQLSVASLAALILLRPSASLLNPTFASALLIMPFAEMATREGHWPHLSTLPSILLAIVAAWCAMYYPARVLDEVYARRYATLAAFLITGIFIGLITARPAFTDVYPHLAHIPDAFASIERKEFYDVVVSQNPATLFFIIAKLPTWCALMILLWNTSCVATRSERGITEKPIREQAAFSKC